MLVILIIVCAMVFFFCIFTIILHGVAKDKLKVEERIKDFVLEEKEERKKTTTKQKRLKVKKNTGFKTRKDALKYEREFLVNKTEDLTMTFEEFYELYYSYISKRIKLNTLNTKRVIFEKKILPYFKNKRMCDIKASDIIKWQNAMMEYEIKSNQNFSQNYLKTLHNQLSALFNFAVRFYNLNKNPARQVGNMGKEENKEMLFWTKEEYLKFSKAIMDKEEIYHAFQILYWCGLRLGELLALTKEDFDLNRSTIRINKSYQRISRHDVITDPKTLKSNRVVQMPDFLREEMEDYFSRLYDLKDKDRIFTVTKSGLHHEMDRGCKISGIKRIRIHDLRHSHVSLLIDMGFSAVDIANRVGHESVKITYRYAHMFPNRDEEIAKKLNISNGGIFDEC